MGIHNKEHWTCFACRKTFRQIGRWNLPAEEQRRLASCGDREVRCPECKQPMRNMGAYFETPRRNDRRAWEVARILADNGLTFGTEGSKAYIEAFITGRQRPNVRKVKASLAADRSRCSGSNRRR